MSQGPITQFFSPTKSLRSSAQKHRDSPRPAADNLIYHALKRLKLQVDDQDYQVPPIKTEDLVHKVPSPRRDSPRMYTAAERMDALEHVSLHGLTNTSRRLNIPCSTLSTWKKDILDRRGIVFARSPLKGKRRKSSAQKLTYGEEVSDDLSTWLSKLRLNKKAVTFEEVRAKIQKKHGVEAFQAKRGFLTEFMTKHRMKLDQSSRAAISESDNDIRNTCVLLSDNGECVNHQVKEDPRDMSEINESEYFSLR